MTIKYIVEPAYIKTSWFAEILEGMKERTNALKYSIQRFTEEELDDKVDMLIIISTSPVWVSKILGICKKLHIVPIVVNCRSQHQPMFNVNQILIDFNNATKECINYLNQCERHSIALFGVNTCSFDDMEKARYFDEEDIYYIGSDNSLQACWNNFLANANKYNAVICTNFIAAVFLVTEAKKVSLNIPEDMYVVAYGSSALGQTIDPSITNVELNFDLVGAQAVELYRYIYKNVKNITATIYTPCDLIPRKSTEYKEYVKKDEALENFHDEYDFLYIAEQNARSIGGFERLLREADDIDWEIIRSLYNKESVASIAERLYVVENSIKYRKKKLLTISKFKSFDDLLDAYERYLSPK